MVIKSNKISIRKYMKILGLTIFTSIIFGCSNKEFVWSHGWPLWKEVYDTTNFENVRLVRNQIIDQISNGIIFTWANNPTNSTTNFHVGGSISSTNELLLYNVKITDNKSETIHIIDTEILISSINGGFINMVWQIWLRNDTDANHEILVKIESIDSQISWSSYLKKHIFILNMIESFVWKWWISLDGLATNNISLLYPEKIRNQLKDYITIDINSHKVILDTDLIKQDMPDSILSKVANFDGRYSKNWMDTAPGIIVDNIDIDGKSYQWDITSESLWLNHTNNSNGDTVNYWYRRFFNLIGIPLYSKHISFWATKWNTKTVFEYNQTQKLDISTAKLNIININFQYKVDIWEKSDIIVKGNWLGNINISQHNILRPDKVSSIIDALDQVEIKSWR